MRFRQLWKCMCLSICLLLYTSLPSLAANMLVTNSADTGDNTLRAAAAASNTTTGHDDIYFAISGPIVLADRINFSDPVTIHGGGVTISGPGPSSFILVLFGTGSDGSIVQNLSFINAYIGLEIYQARNIQILGCRIGTDTASTAGVGNTYGLYIAGNNNQIGGTIASERNIISGNSSIGIVVNAGNNNIVGNYIGTNTSGNAPLENGQGIVINSDSNQIGDPGSGRNVICSQTVGILINSAGFNNRITGNYFGIRSDGTAAITLGTPPALQVYGSRNMINNNFMSTGTSGAVGLLAGEGNTVVANWIGWLPNGTPSGKSIDYGVYLASPTSGNFIGLPESGNGNLICHTGYGIYVDTAINNGFFGNTITSFSTGAVTLVNGGNKTKLAPTLISAIAGGAITGTSEANDTVEVFVREGASGGPVKYVGSVQVNAGVGQVPWSFVPAVGTCQAGDYLCAFATSISNNTSVLSASIVVQVVTPTVTPSLPPTLTYTVTQTRTPTPTRTVTGTITLTETRAPTHTVSPTLTPSATVTLTLTPTVTRTHTISPSVTSTLTPFLLGTSSVLVYPSPAKGSTVWFYYGTHGPAQVEIQIYNLLGEHCITLVDEPLVSGYARTAWDIRATAPGIYFYRVRLKTAKGVQSFPVGKMVIVK